MNANKRSQAKYFPSNKRARLCYDSAMDITKKDLRKTEKIKVKTLVVHIC